MSGRIKVNERRGLQMSESKQRDGSSGDLQPARGRGEKQRYKWGYVRSITYRWSWKEFLAATTIPVGAFAVLFHLIGSAVHQAYLSEWGIDPGQFPKSTDWLAIQGYYGIWNGLGLAFLSLWKHLAWVIPFGAFIGAYFCFVFGPGAQPSMREDLPVWVVRLPGWARRLLLTSGLGALVAAALVPLTLVLFLLTGLPALVGKGIGEEVAILQAQDFATGCLASKAACILLLKEGKQVGEGYLIEGSASHIAFLDTTLKKARVIAREGLELQATRWPGRLPTR